MRSDSEAQRYFRRAALATRSRAQELKGQRGDRGAGGARPKFWAEGVMVMLVVAINSAVVTDVWMVMEADSNLT